MVLVLRQQNIAITFLKRMIYLHLRRHFQKPSPGLFNPRTLRPLILLNTAPVRSGPPPIIHDDPRYDQSIVSFLLSFSSPVFSLAPQSHRERCPRVGIPVRHPDSVTKIQYQQQTVAGSRRHSGPVVNVTTCRVTARGTGGHSQPETVVFAAIETLLHTASLDLDHVLMETQPFYLPGGEMHSIYTQCILI